MKWSDHTFYTLFVREKSGDEIPAIVDIGQQKAYASSTEQDEIAHFKEELIRSLMNYKIYSLGDTNITTVSELPEIDGELFVKAISLTELARNAVVQGCMIFWVEPAKMMEGTTLHLLADTAVVHDQEGQEIAYRSDPLFFEASVDQPAPYKGSVQRWEKVTLGNNDSTGRTPTLYVYDDGLDWQGNPYLPELPESDVPVSSLSASAQAFSGAGKRPCLVRKRTRLHLNHLNRTRARKPWCRRSGWRDSVKCGSLWTNTWCPRNLSTSRNRGTRGPGQVAGRPRRSFGVQLMWIGW